MNSLKKQSTKAFAWDFTGKIAGQSVGFIISIFLARLLTPDDFGLLAMVNVVIAISASLMDMGLGVALIQRKEVNDTHYGSVFFFNITVGFILAVLLFFAAPLVGNFYNNELLMPMARAMSVLFILNSIGNVIRLKLRKELEYGIPTQGNLLGAALSGTVGVIMAFTGFGVWSLVIQSLLNPILSNGYLFYRVKWRPRLIFQWQALKELWNFGFRMFLSGILDTIFNNADTLIIGKLFSPATLGYYFRARSLNVYITQYSSGSLMSVLFPAFSKVQDDLERFKTIVFKGYHLINLLAFFLTGLFFVVGDHLILFLFGDKWQDSIPLFRLIILTAYGYPLSSILVNILTASGNSKKFLQLEVAKRLLITCAFIFGFMGGIKGYLIARIITTVISIILNIHYSKRQLHVKSWIFYWVPLTNVIITSICAGISIYVLSYLTITHLSSLIIGGMFFSLLFATLIWIFKIDGGQLFIEEVKSLKLGTKVKQRFNRN